MSVRAARNCSSTKGSVTFVADVSPSFAKATDFDFSNAFTNAEGSQGCFSANVLRIPSRCMIGKILVRSYHSAPAFCGSANR